MIRHRSSKAPTQKYVISYSIRDGENEYADSQTVHFPSEPTLEQIIHALIEAFTCEDDEQVLAEEKTNAWAWYEKNGYLELPGDYRLIDDIVCEKDVSRRVLITVSGGVADYASDDDVAVCLIDFDNEPNKQIPTDFADLMPQLPPLG